MIIDLYSIDVAILQFINLGFHNNILNSIASFITIFGRAYVAIIIGVLLYFISKNKKTKNYAKLLIISTIVAWLTIEAVKLGVHRIRPYDVITPLYVLAHESSYSFPSGHTTTATVLFYTLSKRYGHWWLFILIPVLVALSRMYLGVHYPSDVLGGFIFGYIVSYLCEYFMKTKNLL